MTEPANTRRQELVAAAFGLLAERGFEGLRTRDVAARAGVNIATLHYYFPTKEALIRAVVEGVMARFVATLSPDGSADGQLRRHFRALRTLFQEEPRIGAVMGEFGLRASRDPTLADLMREMSESWHRIMKGLLRRAVKEGALPPGQDTDEVASLVIATLSSTMLPPLGGTPRSAQALRQLERWLGLEAQPANRRVRSSN